MNDKNLYLIAVHGGAGYYSPSSDLKVKQVLRLACKQSVDVLKNAAGSLTVVERAIEILEDDQCLNAGHGSNLTLDGTVECDAAVMDGLTGDFGSVGAVSGVKNPIRAACAVLNNSRVPDALGRIPPMTLVATGARSFAEAHGIECVPSESLVTPGAQKDWVKWKTRLAQPHPNGTAVTHSEGSSRPFGDLLDVQDTVGAICWDVRGSLAAGVSSGGLLLKQPGRIGEAAVYGAGCWAQQTTNNVSDRGVACSVSGTGEYIVRCMLAKAIAETMMDSPSENTHEILEEILTTRFHEVCRSRGENNPSAGVLLLMKDTNEQGAIIPRLWCAFTTDSMSVAYASSLDPKPKTLILRRTRHVKVPGEPSIYITALPLSRA